MKKALAWTLSILLLLGLMGCGSTSADEAIYDVYDGGTEAMAEMGVEDYYGWTEEAAVEPAAESPTAAAGIDTDTVSYESTLKIIKTGNLTIESETLDETDAFIRQTVSDYQGILAERSISGTVGSRWASYTVRIPSASFDQFFYDVSGSCTVIDQTISSEDVTEQYTDLSTQLETNRKKYERLLELMDQAETLTDLYSIDAELTDVEYEIDRITGILNGLDSRISYSTIYISIQETTKVSAVPEQPSFGASLSAALKNGTNSALWSLQSLILFFAYNWFGILVFLAVLAIVVVVLLRTRKKRRASRQDSQPPEPPETH